MFRRLFFGIAAIVAMLFVAAPASAQQRIALVIGNAAYPRGPIAHSLADGGLVAEALTSVGFEIVEGADVNSGDLRRLFGEFLAKVNAAGPDTIAYIYYSGYAVQFEGDNYLIPVDAQINRDSEIPIQGIRLFDLLRPLADAPATTKIVILDAARALPFQVQGGQLAPGLGAIEAAPGLLVAFSSAPGTVAPDGQGPYGAYATAIAEMVREPGLDIDTMFARIRLRTNETTQGAQTPWDVSQLQQVAILVPGQPAPPAPGAQSFLAPPQTQIGAPVVRRRPPPRPIRDIGPEEAYGYAIEVDNLPTYVDYVRTFPNSPYTPRVWAIIRARREALVWRDALLTNSPDAYWTYLERYPDGPYSFDARRRLRRLSAGDRPPPGWRMIEFADVPPPLADEPVRIITVFPPAPPPRFMRPPPAFIVALPPPPPPGGGGLWRRDQPAFPVIIAPPAGPRPGGGPGGAPGVGGGRPPGPGVAGQPPAGVGGAPPQPPGAPPPPVGAKGPPPEGLPKGANPPVAGAPPAGGPPPAAGGGAPPPVAGGGAPPPAVGGGAPPPAAGGGTPPPVGAKGPPPQGLPKVGNQPQPGVNPPPAGAPPAAGPAPAAGGGAPPPVGAKGPAPQGLPKVGNQPPAGGPAGGPPGVGAGGPPAGAPKGPPPQPSGPPAGVGAGGIVPKGPPEAIKGPPPQVQKGPPPPQLQQNPPAKQPPIAAPPPPPPKAPAPPPPPQVKAPPPPPPPPQVKAPPPPPPPPPPPQVKAPPPPPPPQVQKGPPPGPPPGAGGGPPQGQKGPPPQGKGPAGLPKCAVTGGKQPCQP